MTARHHVVQAGETLSGIAEAVGVDKEELAQRNRQTLQNAATARGFDSHIHYRLIREETGRPGVFEDHKEVDYHVFPGEVLELRDPEPDEPGHPDFKVRS